MGIGGHRTAQVESILLQQLFISLLLHSVLTTCSFSNVLKQLAFPGDPSSQLGVHTHTLHRSHPSTHRGRWPAQDFPQGCLFPKASDFDVLAGSSIAGSQTGPHTERARRDRRKRQITPDWQAAGLTSKRTYLQGLSWVATRLVNFCTLPPNLFFFFNKHTLPGCSLYTVHMLSTTHCSVKATSLNTALILRTVGRWYTSNTVEGMKSF